MSYLCTLRTSGLTGKQGDLFILNAVVRDRTNREIMDLQTKPLRFRGDGPPASFLHANGFPPAAYEPFLKALSRHLDVTAYPMRSLSGAPLDSGTQWSDLGHELATQVGPGTIAIGHSLGATASMTAVAEHPDLFSALVVIEPAMLNRWLSFGFRFVPYFIRQRIGPAAKARVKRDRWPDRQAFLESCRRSGLYAGMSERGLQIFADAALYETDGGVTLTFPKDWEAHFYTNPPWPAQIFGKIRKPVVGLRGRSTIFLDDTRWRDLTSRQPTGWFEQMLDAGHLLPLEHPEFAAAMVIEGLQAVGVVPITK
ncbi:alpha/beta fold hydrolase [Pseudomonas sp. Z3-6]|uniref:alpha/beta fold hydrolase n=1 Tax=Pseudomonas sp. Z3-6 TaxID=2817411 RepID=UPI003DA9E07E